MLQADVGAPDFASRLCDALAGRTAAAAIAAAGVIAGGPGWATSEESWSTLIDVNLHGARRFAEATVPGMVAARARAVRRDRLRRRAAGDAPARRVFGG